MPMDVGRRRVIGAGVAGLLLSGWTARAAVRRPGGGSVVKPMAESRTIVRFVQGLGDGEGYNPPKWFSDVVGDIFWPDAPPDGVASIEREQAELFARFAVGFVAPHYLRTAGYHDLAANCECDTDLRATRRSAARAQQSIGIIGRIRSDRAGRPTLGPQRESMAYSSAAFTSTARFYALMDEGEHFSDAGYFAARALAPGLTYDDPVEADPAETVWLWNVALMAIYHALHIGRIEPEVELG